MNVSFEIPDDIAARLETVPASEPMKRRALEGFALEECKSGRISKAELRRMLGFSTRYRLDGFLKAHNVDDGYTLEELEQDRADLESFMSL